MDDHFSNIVLSIQSHVVHGFVGNKVAAFTLQILGFEVDDINSCFFSNHTGYPSFTGRVTTDENLTSLMNGLEKNNMLQKYRYMLTGYIGSAPFLITLIPYIRTMKEKESFFYLCDPVMGDSKAMYVPRELLTIYRDNIIPLSDCITPNQFEAELLCGFEFTTLQKVYEGIKRLHSFGPRYVIITSIDLDFDKNSIMIIGSDSITKNYYKWTISRFQGYFTGAGDLFSSLLLAWISKGFDLRSSLERVIYSVGVIIYNTHQYAKDHDPLHMRSGIYTELRNAIEFPEPTDIGEISSWI